MSEIIDLSELPLEALLMYILPQIQVAKTNDVIKNQLLTSMDNAIKKLEQNHDKQDCLYELLFWRNKIEPYGQNDELRGKVPGKPPSSERPLRGVQLPQMNGSGPNRLPGGTDR